MSPSTSSEVKFEIGHVLFIDIVGYSQLLITQQSEQLETLRRIVRGTAQFRAAEAEGKLLRLPTGDGAALVFRTTTEAPVLCALEISKELKKHPELSVRMGIHSGPVNPITDLNEQANIAGAGINIAQRVMDCGDAGHILLSKHVAEDLEHYPRWQPYLHDLGECEVKHGVRVSVVNLYTDDAGNAALPTRLAAQKRFPAKGTQSTGFRTLLVAAMILIGLGVPALIFTPAILKSLRSPISGDKAASSSIPDKSIAVLPFENLSDDKGAAYFADGIQDEILTRLAKIGDLKVISRTSTLRYKSRPENLLEIAKQLGVAHILEGSVQKSGDRVRINVQLINAQTDTHLWAETYDRTLTDVFAVESEVAQRVADSLRATLTGVEKATLATKPTENAAAYDAYLRGLAVVASNRESIEAFTSAADFFDTAVRLDPKFALAWARASIAHSRMYWAGYDRGPARVEKARQAAEKARELQPDAGETFLARGYYEYVVVRDYDAAWSAFKEGVLRLPNNADALVSLSFIERRKGLWPEAVAHQEQAARLDPQNVPVLSQLGVTYFALKRFADAHTIVDRLLGLAPENPQVLAGLARLDLAEGNLEAAETAMRSVAPAPSNDYVFEIQVRLALIAGRYADAIQLIEHAFAQTPAPAGFFAGKYRYDLGFAKELAGDAAGARAAYETARAELAKVLEAQPASADAHLYLAFALAGLGEKDAAYSAAKRAIALRPSVDAVVGASFDEAFARVKAHFGENDAAIADLQRLLETNYLGPEQIALTPALLRLDPAWMSLRKDPRFEALVQKVVAPKTEPKK